MGRVESARWMMGAWAGAALALAGCGAENSPGQNPVMNPNPVMTGAGSGGSGTPAQGGAMAGSAAAPPKAGSNSPTPSATAGMGGGTPVSMNGGASGSNMAGAGTAGAAGGSTNPMTPHTGPVDGDPAKPMVSIPNVPCGPANVGFGGPPAGNMVKITNRDVFVAYPCAHEGAAVTFYLAIHGTLGEGQKIPFTLLNFPIHTKVDSDNFIVVAPQAVGQQWGNGDGGMDLPHLYEVIDWVYNNFGEKFSIRGMWASGGSWGSAYLYNFACDPKLENRLTGIRMIVGRGCPPCSTRLSCIVGEQELEEGGGMMLTDPQKEMKIMATQLDRYAMMHGCDARTGPTNLGPVRAWTWANCDGGFQHSYYLGPGQHADRWDDPMYVTHMTAEMKAADR